MILFINNSVQFIIDILILFCRVGQGHSSFKALFPLTPRQTVREVFPHTAFLNNICELISVYTATSKIPGV